MNPAQLLAHFNRLADAPDAIPRMRRFILDLAVRGKLVEQDSNDEPARELLERIRAEKARLVKAGKIRNRESYPPVEQDAVPFALPVGWVCCSLGELIHLVGGQHLQPGQYSHDKSDGPPYITGPADFGEKGLVITRYAKVIKAVAQKGQILLTVKGAGVGKTAVCNLPEVAISRQLMAVTAIEWNDRFLLLTTHRLATTLQENARSLIPGISREDVEQFIIGLPPLAEQHRIVAKVDELMALCDRLKTAQKEREGRRDRLVAASLNRLNQPADDAASFRKDAQFTLDNLPRLATRPEHVTQLRQTILNLAVRGKLVPQDANDEPAAELLKEIKVEKERLIKEKKLKRQHSRDPIENEQIPFEPPLGWTWAKADDVFLNITDGFHNTPVPVAKGLPYITAMHVKQGRIDFENCLHVDERNHKELFAKTRVKKGDILIVNIGAGSGTPAVVDVDFEFSFKNVAIVNTPKNIDQNYIVQFLIYYREFVFEELIKGGAQPFLGLGMLREMLISLPPLAEQHRIVAKVDELMALCDRLEAELATTQTESRRLLEAVLHEALSPSN